MSTLYGDNIFESNYDLNKLILKSNRIISELYEFDNIIYSIDESFKDKIKYITDKFIKFIQSIIDTIKKIIKIIKDKFKELTNKIFNKSNEKIMTEAIKELYNTCPKSDDPLDKIEAECNKLSNILEDDEEMHELKISRTIEFITEGRIILFEGLKNEIILERKNINKLNAIFNYISSLITLFPNQKPKNPTPDSIIKEYMSMKDNSDKQAYIAISAVKNYNNLNLWKELIRLVQISEISENNTNESFNLLNEVADTEERKHREKNFKDRVYDRFNFPKLKPIVFCKVKSSSLSNIEQILNLADSYNNKEDLDKKIVELLDIKDQFRDSEIISKAIKQPYSKDYINNISKAINQAWKDEIYLETAKDARDYYRKMPLEKALKAVQIYHDNLTIFHIGLESTYEEYGKYLYKIKKIYESNNNESDINMINIRKEAITSIYELVMAINNFVSNYRRAAEESGLGLIKFIRSFVKFTDITFRKDSKYVEK